MTADTLKCQEGLVEEQQGTSQHHEPSSNGSSSADCKVEDEAFLAGPYDRLLGDTEHNWCRAVAGGTGITVLGFLLSRKLDSSNLQTAIDVVQLQHPRLRSQLLWIHGRPAFQVCNKPIVKVEVLDKDDSSDENTIGSSDNRDTTSVEYSMQELHIHNNQQSAQARRQENTDRGWLNYVEDELNINLWPQRDHFVQPVQMFVVRLYRLPQNRSLVILRVHTAACDRVSAATVLADILKALLKISKGELSAPDVTTNNDDEAESGQVQEEVPTGTKEKKGTFKFMAVEAAIPPGKANKPFWAHGIDLLGYSLGSRRHAVLPFEDTNSPRRTELIRSSLSYEHTQALLQACIKAKASLYGAICAAGLKAAAIAKKLGNRSEHFAVISLVDCRRYLEPAVSDTTVGFYHSALMCTHQLNEAAEFWELARRCSGSLDTAMNNRKHFTDMGDLNYLMYQAISHPNLTPSGSLRTSLLVTFRDTVSNDLEDMATALGLEDYIGCSSIHGVGPSMAVFDAIRNGELHCANVYPAPLHSRAQMETYVDSMMHHLIKFLP